ncbi:MAG TPA: hypothetical protein VFH58_03300 [Acidimicrobiales bacterium]|nr:hypothetical protein [Acidimicrobiales bacterium]
MLTVIGSRSCSSSPPSSPVNPATLVHNGLSGLCANEQAAAAASGDGSAQTLQIPANQAGLAGAAQAAGLSPGTLTCPTTSVAGGS